MSKRKRPHEASGCRSRQCQSRGLTRSSDPIPLPQSLPGAPLLGKGLELLEGGHQGSCLPAGVTHLGHVGVGRRPEFTPWLAKSELWISDLSLPCGFLLLPLEMGWEGIVLLRSEAGWRSGRLASTWHRGGGPFSPKHHRRPPP